MAFKMNESEKIEILRRKSSSTRMEKSQAHKHKIPLLALACLYWVVEIK